MPRQVRVEFPGAVYHAMARGNRKEPIVQDDEDRARFRLLLAELVQQTGWEVFSWVLMSNHYHLVFKTPEANLVEGMKWFQNTWTKRYNARHRMWGRLYGDRYKAILVEENEHLATLIDYVHLNPFRAGLVKLEDGLESYTWSSLGDYLKPPRRRSGWVEVARGLAQRELGTDTAPTRKRYIEHLESIAMEREGVPASPGEAQRTLQSTLRRGWYFGTEQFREKLLKRLEKTKKGTTARYGRSSGYTGAQERDHGERTARQLLKQGLAELGLSKGKLEGLRKNDWRKRAIGRLIRRNTTVPAGWIAEQLRMGHPVRTATLTSRDPEKSWGPEWRRAQRLIGCLEKELKS